MGQIGQIQAEFNWDLLVVADSNSDLQVPDPDPPTDLVVASVDAAVINVQHAQTGETTVRIWDESNESLRKILLGQCRLAIPTGEMVVGDVERLLTTIVTMTPADYELTIFGDSTIEAELVDIVVSKAKE